MSADPKSDSTTTNAAKPPLAPAPTPSPTAPPTAKRSTTTYPYYGIEQSLAVAKAVAKLGTNDVRDEDIAKELGREPSSRFFSYYTSSAREFGLITRNGRAEAMRTSLTDLGRRAISRIDEASTRATLLSVFVTPPLYKSIAEKYSGLTLPDAEGLANLFSLQFGIVDGVKLQAAQALIDSATFAGFLRDGTLDLGPAVAKPPAPTPNPPPFVPPTPDDNDESKTLTLASGATMKLSLSTSIIKLPKAERTFVLGIIDMLEGYNPNPSSGTP